MTVKITTAAAVDCGGAWIRAHCRALATVVTVHGDIDAVNVDRLGERARRLVLLGNPLILDLSGVDSFAGAGMSLLHAFDEDCCAAGVEWTLVAGPAVLELLRDGDAPEFPLAGSVAEALRDRAAMMDRRRHVLLPLVSKSA